MNSRAAHATIDGYTSVSITCTSSTCRAPTNCVLRVAPQFPNAATDAQDLFFCKAIWRGKRVKGNSKLYGCGGSKARISFAMGKGGRNIKTVEKYIHCNSNW